MSALRLAISFADNPGTTGKHLLRSAERLGSAADLEEPRADWSLWVESFGEQLQLPTSEQISDGRIAVWLIDSHVNIRWQRRLASAFAHVFVAQRSAVSELEAAGVPVSWLPLAAPDDLVERGRPLHERPYDIAFVGSAPPGSSRATLLRGLAEQFAVAPVAPGFTSPEEMLAIYRASRVVVNLPIGGDLNMRCFEAAAAGSLLATLPCDGLEEIFPPESPLVIEEATPVVWAEKLREALAARDLQDRADAMHDAVRDGHTYAHRVVEILTVLGRTQPAELPLDVRLRALLSGHADYGQPRRAWSTRNVPLGRRARYATTAVATAALRRVYAVATRRGARPRLGRRSCSANTADAMRKRLAADSAALRAAGVVAAVIGVIALATATPLGVAVGVVFVGFASSALSVSLRHAIVGLLIAFGAVLLVSSFVGDADLRERACCERVRSAPACSSSRTS